ncbi:Kinetochore-associated protein NNF1 [Pseudocercospora fuligena]|uniref:Kinetochore-associated protein NNF1 n=1 Tax=Pseudocercospora fuligena TaxID=685502 RepID=A0A8H6R7R3_9PEZI|nr:Kinetochore-associated protein NNF1 [Pseudocercospora fuligena]
MTTSMDLDNPSDPTSRSPSPIQPPPTPSAPGPRATALQKLYHDAITHVLKTCNYTNFSSCFPTPSRQVPGSVKLLHEQFTEKLGESMRKEFDSILAERNVISSLNELDRLIEDAKKRKSNSTGTEPPVPSHTLPARQLYISHLAPTLGKFSADMNSRQESLGRENEQIMERIIQQRKDIKRLLDGLENVVRDLNGSVDAMEPERLEELREEVREVDEGMRE